MRQGSAEQRDAPAQRSQQREADERVLEQLARHVEAREQRIRRQCAGRVRYCKCRNEQHRQADVMRRLQAAVARQTGVQLWRTVFSRVVVRQVEIVIEASGSRTIVK